LPDHGYASAFFDLAYRVNEQRQPVVEILIEETICLVDHQELQILKGQYAVEDAVD
jgi:hypothetical protein